MRAALIGSPGLLRSQICVLDIRDSSNKQYYIVRYVAEGYKEKYKQYYILGPQSTEYIDMHH